jgi:ribosomal protein S6--L-glutamate ligase
LTHDLYILKSHAALWLSLAEIVHAHGGRLLNPFPGCLAVQNKIVAVERMRAAGIPTPRSWATSDPKLLRSIVEKRPVIIKPYNGGRGIGVVVARDPHELAKAPPRPDPVLIQEYIRHGQELKVYVIGEEVFGMSARPGSRDGRRRPCPITPEVREVALRCGRVFELGLYGVDVMETCDGPMVIDLNYFPSYQGMPYAPALIAEFIENYALGGACGGVRDAIGSIDGAVA